MVNFCKTAYEVLYLINKGIRDFSVVIHEWVSLYPAESRASVIPIPIPLSLQRDPRIKKAYQIVGRSIDDVLMTLEYVIASEKALLPDKDSVIYFIVESPDMLPGQVSVKIMEELERAGGEEP